MIVRVSWSLTVFLLSLFAVLMLLLPAEGAHYPYCEPVTLEGWVAFAATGTDGDGREVLKVVWQETNRKLMELVFLKEEVRAESFFDERRLDITTITFLEKGCRSDGRRLNILLEPKELKRPAAESSAGLSHFPAPRLNFFMISGE